MKKLLFVAVALGLSTGFAKKDNFKDKIINKEFKQAREIASERKEGDVDYTLSQIESKMLVDTIAAIDNTFKVNIIDYAMAGKFSFEIEYLDCNKQLDTELEKAKEYCDIIVPGSDAFFRVLASDKRRDINAQNLRFIVRTLNGEEFDVANNKNEKIYQKSYLKSIKCTGHDGSHRFDSYEAEASYSCSVIKTRQGIKNQKYEVNNEPGGKAG